MNIHTDSTTLMLQFLMESVRRLEEKEKKNEELIRSLLQSTCHHHRTTIPANTIPISSSIFTAPVDAAAAAPGQRNGKGKDVAAETCPTCDRAFPSASTAIPLVASAPAAQTIPPTARINDVDMVM
ncbi:hypothetical protein HDU78_001714, partial [Chytriomyces hyalinus]